VAHPDPGDVTGVVGGRHVPESADSWDASHLVGWGTSLPITRTPDAHFVTDAR
jgi:nitrate reductase alpha subunit